jgi:S1-C subfamily serine protease/tetratricopeptide (TPR) repeat protein
MVPIWPRKPVGSRVLALFALGVAFGQTPDAAAKVYAQASRSVLVILVTSANGRIVAQGSGFLIENGKIITNQHVVKSGSPLIDLGGARIPVTVELVDEANDLAVLTTSAEISADPLSLAGSVPPPGSAVFAIGNPLGLEKSISAGVVAGVRKVDARELIQVTAPISPGSSGGPVLDASGRVVGVAVGSLEDGQNINFAVPAAAVTALLSGKPAAQADIASLIDSAKSLGSKRGEYSDDPNSPYQKTGAQMREMLSTAVTRATKEQIGLVVDAAKELAVGQDIVVAAAERAMQLQPSVAASLDLARALDWQGVFTQDESLRRGSLERAEKAARRALSLAEQPNADVYYTLGDILEDQNKHSDANSALLRALDLNQKAPTQDAAQRARILRDLINAAEALGRPADRDNWFNALVATDQALPWDWEGQAKRLDAAKRYAEAGAAWQQAASANYTPWTDWCEAADSFWFGGDQDSVLYDARQCIAKGSGKPQSEQRLALAHREVADVLSKRGVYEESLSHAKESTVLTPEEPWAYDSEAVALIGLRRFQEAINAAK